MHVHCSTLIYYTHYINTREVNKPSAYRISQQKNESNIHIVNNKQIDSNAFNDHDSNFIENCI